MQWASLIAGVIIMILGVRELIQQGQWVLMILGMLIVGFSISKMARTSGKK
jgi:uncharacterized membrane protein